MKLEDIKSIKQTADQDEVNKHLKKGYSIVKIFSGKIPINEHGDTIVQPIYVLGKSKSVQ